MARVCSGDCHLSPHLTFTRAITSSPDPATWGFSVCVGLVQRMESLKYYRLSTGAKAWDFSDERIASLRRSLVTGSKYSVVDQARTYTYTPTAHRRPPVDSVFQVLSEEQTKLQKEDDKHLILPNEVDLPFSAKSCKQRWRTSAVHIAHMHEPDRGYRRSPTNALDCWRLSNLTSILEP